MDLSLVIPTHKRHEGLFALLASIKRQKQDKAVMEVIVVSNLEDQVLQKKLALSHPEVKFFHTGVIGVNYARNLGLKNAKASKVYFLDDDVLLENPGHLETLLNLSQENSEAVAIGGSYKLNPKASIVDHVYHGICTSWIKKKDHSVYLLGGNTLYQINNFKRDYKFNENILFGGSETELNLRLFNDHHTFIYSENLTINHNTDLNAYLLIKKAIFQGMGRSLHETIVSRDFWEVDTNDAVDILENFKNKKMSYFLASCHLHLYEFFFHVGYRHGKKTNNAPFSLPVAFLSSVETFFQIDSDKILYIPNPHAKAFHLKSHPSLKFRELHHWAKGNIWWKIPNYIFWKMTPLIVTFIVCALWNLIPFNTVGLRVPYDRMIGKIENFFRKKA